MTRLDFMQAIRECETLATKQNVTAYKKAVHSAIIWELQDLLTECQRINKYLFDPKHYEWLKLYQNDYKEGATKAQLDRRASTCKRMILNEIHGFELMVNEIQFD